LDACGPGGVVVTIPAVGRVRGDGEEGETRFRLSCNWLWAGRHLGSELCVVEDKCKDSPNSPGCSSKVYIVNSLVLDIRAFGTHVCNTASVRAGQGGARVSSKLGIHVLHEDCFRERECGCDETVDQMSEDAYHRAPNWSEQTFKQRFQELQLLCRFTAGPGIS